MTQRKSTKPKASKPTKPKASGAAGADATTLDDADRLAALEARLVRALRRYLAPELASRATRDAILAVTEPEPEHDEEFTEAEDGRRRQPHEQLEAPALDAHPTSHHEEGP